MNNKVLLIDRNPIFCHGVKTVLGQHDFEVVATVSSSGEGIKLMEQLTPSIVLLTMEASQGNSLPVLKRLREQHQDLRIVLLTERTNSNTLRKLLQVGMHGYLAKNIEPGELVAALQNILKGQTIVPPELSFVLTRFRQMQLSKPNQQELPALIATLTPREFETLVLLTKGMNNKIIARNMELTEGTVKNHVKAILNKLRVDTRINAAVMALEQGIGAEPDTDTLN